MACEGMYTNKNNVPLKSSRWGEVSFGHLYAIVEVSKAKKRQLNFKSPKEFHFYRHLLVEKGSSFLFQWIESCNAHDFGLLRSLCNESFRHSTETLDHEFSFEISFPSKYHYYYYYYYTFLTFLFFFLYAKLTAQQLCKWHWYEV